MLSYWKTWKPQLQEVIFNDSCYSIDKYLNDLQRLILDLVSSLISKHPVHLYLDFFLEADVSLPIYNLQFGLPRLLSFMVKIVFPVCSDPITRKPGCGQLWPELTGFIGHF